MSVYRGPSLNNILNFDGATGATGPAGPAGPDQLPIVDTTGSTATHYPLMADQTSGSTDGLIDTNYTYEPSTSTLNVPVLRTDQIGEASIYGVDLERINFKDDLISNVRTITVQDQDFIPPNFEMTMSNTGKTSGFGLFSEVSSFPNFRDGIGFWGDNRLAFGFPNMAFYTWDDGVATAERRNIISGDINQLVGKDPAVAQGIPVLNFLNNTNDTFLDTPPVTGLFVEPNGLSDVDFGFVQKGTKQLSLPPGGGLDTTDIRSTGNITVGDGSVGRAIEINGPIGGANSITFKSNDLNRWRLDVSAAETGGDVGAQFRLRAYDDAGVEKGVALYCARTNLEFVSGGNFRRLGSATTAECGINIFPWAAVHGLEFLATNLIRSAVNNVATLGNDSYRFNEIYCTNGTINTSDINLKQDITDLGETMSDPTAFLMSLRPVMYRWKGSTETGPPTEDGDPTTVEIPAGTRYHLGLIAQEVAASLDAAGVDKTTFGAWTQDTTTGMQGIRYTELIPMLIHANKQMITTIRNLTTRIEALEAK